MPKEVIVQMPPLLRVPAGTLANNSSAEKLNVVTSVAPINNIIKNIGGDRID